MRILYAESKINWGGQEYRVLKQMEWLREIGHEAFLAARSGSEIIERGSSKGLTVIAVNYSGTSEHASIYFGFTVSGKVILKLVFALL